MSEEKELVDYCFKFRVSMLDSMSEDEQYEIFQSLEETLKEELSKKSYDLPSLKFDNGWCKKELT